MSTKTADSLRNILSDFAPAKAKFGKIGVFYAADTGKPFDVLYVEVASPDLRRMRSALKQLPHTELHPSYNPHVTIAYVKPGMGDAIAARMTPPSGEFTASEVVYSDRYKRKSVIPLPQPHSHELSATLRPAEDDPNVKRNALDLTQKRLLRVRKSTIAQLLALAMVRKQQEATAAGNPKAAAGSLQELASLASDPMQVARIVGLNAQEMSAFELAWTAFQTKRGTTGAVSDTLKTAQGQPKRVYGAEASAVLGAQGRRETRDGGAKQARESLNKIITGKASKDDLEGLGASIHHMRLKDINEARLELETALKMRFNMRGEKGKKKRIELLLAHVDNVVGKVDTDPKPVTTDPAPKSPAAEPPAAANGRVAGLDDTAFAQKVLATASGHPRRLIKGGSDVWIHDVYDALKKEDPSLTEDGFKQRLVDANVKGRLKLTTADLIQAFDAPDISRAATKQRNSTYHAITAGPEKAVAPSEPKPVGPTKTQTKADAADQFIAAAEAKKSAPEPATKVTRTGKETKTNSGERAVAKAQVAGEALVKAFRENANPARLLELQQRAVAAADDLPDDLKEKYLAKLKAALPAPDPEPAPVGVSKHYLNEDNDEPEQSKPSSVSSILAEEAATLAKRRAKAAPVKAPIPPPAPAKIEKKVAEEIAKPAPKPVPADVKTAPKKPLPRNLKKVPGDNETSADRDALTVIRDKAPDEVKSLLDDAIHNMNGPDVESKGTAPSAAIGRRRDTLAQLAASWRAAIETKKSSAAESVGKIIERFGGTLAGKPPGKNAQFDGAQYDSIKGVFPGDPVVVVRQPVVWKQPNGDEFVVLKGVVKRKVVK